MLASGRGSNLQALIDAQEEGRLPARILAVISDRSDALALTRARRHGISIYTLDPQEYPGREAFDAALLKLIQSLEGVRYIALAGFMRILTPVVIRAFPGRIINIHPSLLPAFPGLQAQRQALEYGVRYSGCTVHLVDEGMDTGPIIDQRVVPVFPQDTEEELARRILAEEHKLYPEALALLAHGKVKVMGRRVVIEGRNP